MSSFSFGVEHEEKSCASGFIQYNRLPLREQPGPTLAGKVNKSQHGLRALNVGQDNVSPVGEDTCEDTDDVPFIGIKRMVRKASGRPSQLVVRGEGPGTSGEETEEIPIIAARGKIQKTTHGGKLRRRAYGPRRPIPKVLAEADAPDKMLVEMREKGCTWAEIQKAWHEQTGQKISSSTMVTRHARIIQNTDHLQRDDEKRLLAAEAAVEHDFRRQKWRLVVEAMSRAGAAHYSEAFIQRHFEILSQIPITAGNTSDEDFELPQPAGPMPHASESMRCRNRCGRCGKYYKISSGLQYHIERHPSCASEPLKAHKSNISLEPSATGSAPIDYPADTPASRAFDRNNTSSKLVIGNVADHGPIPAQQNASQNTEGSFLGETNATELTQSADSYPHFLRLHPNASGAAKSASSKRCDKCGRRYRGRSGLNYHKARYPDCVSQTPRPHISTKKGKNSKSKPKAKEWIHGLPKPPRSQQILSNNLTSPIVNQNLKPTSQVDQTENSRPIRSAIINMGSEKFDRLGADPAPTGTRALLSARMKEVRARRRAAGDSGRYGSSPNPRKVADKAASGVPLAGPRHNVLFPSLTEDQSPLPQESTPDITKLVPRERRPTEYLRMENKSKQRRFSCKSCGRHYTTPSAVNAHCRRFPNCVSDGPVRRDSRTQPSGRKAGNRRSARKIQKAALGVIFPNLLTRQVTPIRSLVGEPPLEDQIQPQINSERPTPPANTVSNVADQTQPDPPKPVGVKPFGCGKCGKKYTNKDGLWVHYDCKPDCNPEWRRIKQAKRAARRAAWAAAAANSRTTATTELAVTHPNNVVTDVAAVAEHSNAFTAEPSTYATTKEAAAVAGLLDTSAAEPLIETITNEAAGARPSDTLEARMVTDVSSQEQTPEKLSYQDKKLSGKHYNWVGCLSGHDASAPALFDTSTAAQENQA